MVFIDNRGVSCISLMGWLDQTLTMTCGALTHTVTRLDALFGRFSDVCLGGAAGVNEHHLVKAPIVLLKVGEGLVCCQLLQSA